MESAPHMANQPPRRFFDSDVLTRLLENREEAETIEALVYEAAAGRWTLVVTSVTLLEVTRQRNSFDPAKHARVMSFFENDYIFVRELDLLLTEKAIKLIYDYTWLHPMDAAHLAAAIDMGCQVFDTYEEQLIDRFHEEHGLSVQEPEQPFDAEIVDLTDLPLFGPPK